MAGAKYVQATHQCACGALELSQYDLQTCDDSVNQFVIVFLLVFGYQEELSVASQLADVTYAPRTVARKEMGEFTVELGAHGSLPSFWAV
jgi:hypothetical protein